MRFAPALRWLARPSARIAGTSVLAMVAMVFAPPAAAHQSRWFTGTPAVGALFTTSDGTLGTHFCTASVVHSPGGNLLITAAHCVTGRSGTIAFVPGFNQGKAPYGVWYVSRVYADQAWSASRSIDDDVAFLQVRPDQAGAQIEDITGANQLALDEAAGQLTQVIGYPDGAGQPVVCDNQTRALPGTPAGAAQLQFDCGGYPDGTSGGPFLVHVNQSTGEGTVTGVIGGYEQGGDSPSVSYSIAFGANVGALYRTATAAAS